MKEKIKERNGDNDSGRMDYGTVYAGKRKDQ